MAITLAVTTTAYATTAVANNVYALTVTDAPTVTDNTYYLMDSSNQMLYDSGSVFITDSEG